MRLSVPVMSHLRLARPESGKKRLTSPWPIAADKLFHFHNCSQLTPELLRRQKRCCWFSTVVTGDRSAPSSCEASKKISSSSRQKACGRWPSALTRLQHLPTWRTRLVSPLPSSPIRIWMRFVVMTSCIPPETLKATTSHGPLNSWLIPQEQCAGKISLKISACAHAPTTCSPQPGKSNKPDRTAS